MFIITAPSLVLIRYSTGVSLSIFLIVLLSGLAPVIRRLFSSVSAFQRCCSYAPHGFAFGVLPLCFMDSIPMTLRFIGSTASNLGWPTLQALTTRLKWRHDSELSIIPCCRRSPLSLSLLSPFSPCSSVSLLSHYSSLSFEAHCLSLSCRALSVAVRSLSRVQAHRRYLSFFHRSLHLSIVSLHSLLLSGSTSISFGFCLSRAVTCLFEDYRRRCRRERERKYLLSCLSIT